MAEGVAGGRATARIAAARQVPYAARMTTSAVGAGPSSWRAWVRVPPPGEAVAGWHVSPLVDVLAYHFSWLWILVPLMLAPGDRMSDWLLLWSVGVTVSFVHRHWTMPYVYLDRQVFTQHPTRFALLFALLMLAVIATAFLQRFKSPEGFFLPIDVALAVGGVLLVAQVMRVDRAGRALSWGTQALVFAPYLVAVVLGVSGVFVSAHVACASAVLIGFALSALVLWRQAGAPVLAALVALVALAGVGSALAGAAPLVDKAVRGSVIVGPFAVLAALWNVWHTLMQKYGIMRVYAAKSPAPLEQRTPGWVDRLFIFSWFPLLALVVGPAQRDTILRFGAVIKPWLIPILDGIDAVRPVLLVPAIGLVVGAAALFVRREQQSGTWSAPRLSMALALTLLNATFLFVNPLKVYIAYGFSHAVEYMVFVWAFQRRRYASELPHKPLLGAVLKRAFVFYALYSGVIGAVYFFVQYGDDYGWRTNRIELAGLSAGTWMFAFAIWHSIAHFWYDGFLWKMRLPAVRASL